jgi:hypothetical protein
MMGVVNTMSLWSASLMYPRITIYGVTGTIYINDPVIITEMGLRFFVFEKCAESFNSFRKILGLGVSFWGRFSLPRYTVSGIPIMPASCYDRQLKAFKGKPPPPLILFGKCTAPCRWLPAELEAEAELRRVPNNGPLLLCNICNATTTS